MSNSIIRNPNSSLPEGWRRVRLREVCKIDSNQVLPNTSGARELPYIGLEHIESETGKITDTVTRDNNTSIQSTTFRFDSHHVLYGKLRPYLNKVALPNFEGRCTTELLPLLPAQGCDRCYLAWLLRQSETVAEAMRYKTGTRMPRADMDELFRMLVPLPPLAEQKRIAVRVQELMVEVEHARTACEAQLEAAKALPSAYLRQVFESEEAKNWERRMLGELFHVQQGVAMSPARREGISPHPFLRTLNVLWGHIDLSMLDEMDFTDEEVAKLSLKSNDLLVCEGGEVGRTAIWRGELRVCLYQNHVHRLRRLNDNVVPDFYMYWMQAAFKVFGVYSGLESKTTIPNLSGSQLKSFKVPRPSIEEQKRIASELRDKISQAEKLKVAIEKQLEAINALPQAILKKAFIGEL